MIKSEQPAFFDLKQSAVYLFVRYVRFIPGCTKMLELSRLHGSV